MIELRPYQQASIESVAASYRRGIRRPLIGLPTGTGKTVIFSAIARSAAAKGSRVLIMAHRDELLQQAADKLLATAPELRGRVGFVAAKLNDWSQPVTIASVQSLHPRRLARMIEAGCAFDLVVVDEAHHAAADSYVAVLESLGCLQEGGPLTIGVTATPQRADSRDLGEIWEEIVYHRDMLSMIREGYLCDLRGIAIRLSEFDASALHVRAGDYVASEVADALTAAEAPEHTVKAWRKHADGRKTIVFTPTVALASEMAEAFREDGVTAVNISASANIDERRETIRRFQTGEVKVVTNALLLTEGFDEPSVECIVIARPTRSQPLYVQMVGRGSRISPGKKDCIVMDLVGATDRLDLTTLPRLFGLDAAGAPDSDQEAAIAERGIVAYLDDRDEQERRMGRIVAQQVELFNRRDLAWTCARPGLWVLSLGEESIHLEADQGGTWTVNVYPRERSGVVVTLKSGLPQGYAMGVAEDYARKQGRAAARLIDKAADWRSQPASQKQRDTLRRLRVDQHDAPELSKGEASDLLSAAIAVRRSR